MGRQIYSDLEVEIRKRKKAVDTSWRMDEIYIKIKGKWHYLDRAVDKEGKTIDFSTNRVTSWPPNDSCSKQSTTMELPRKSPLTEVLPTSLLLKRIITRTTHLLKSAK
jgi:hypothetical protein